MKNYLIQIAYVFFVVFIPLTSSHADLSSTYGLGSVSSALTNSNKAYPHDAFSMIPNPALLAQQPRMLSVGLQGAIDQFKDLHNIVIENEYTGSSSQKLGDMDTDVPDVLSASLGNVWKFGENPRALRAGINIALPADKVAEPNMGDGYLPQYTLYQSDAQRFNLSFAAAKDVGHGFSVGMGAHYYFVTGATYRARMPTDGTPPKTSTAKLRAAVRPSLAPFLGLHWNDKTTYLGLSYTAARDYKFEAKVDNIIDILGGGGSLFAFNMTGSLFYDPEIWSAHWALNKEQYKLFMALDFERWSLYGGPYADLQFETFNGFKSYPRDNSFEDILVPRAGVEFNLNKTTDLLIGYSYRPTPIHDQTGKTNLLDSDRHMVGLGSRFHFEKIWLIEIPGALVIHTQYQQLVSKKIDKVQTTDIGSPGYEVGGQVWAYGLQLNLNL